MGQDIDRSSAAGAVIGYASVPVSKDETDDGIKAQAELMAAECERRGLELLQVVGERVPVGVKPLERPALAYALAQIADGAASGLVVADLARLSHSAAELGAVIRRLAALRARLLAPAQALDTHEEKGRLAAELLIEISGWERKWLSERTRKGLEVARRNRRATGRGAVSDYPDLIAAITRMRESGMTLQAIADQLNADHVPTIRGGRKWRHSSVQAAVGYRRRRAVEER